MSDQSQFWRFNDAGQLKTSVVTGIALPANSTLRDSMAFAPAGELCVDLDPPSGQYFGGLRLRSDGAVYATASAPTFWVGGLPVDGNGALCVSSAGVVTVFRNVGFTTTGAVATT